MAGQGHLIVRSQVLSSADRAAFDAWYEAEHLPAAAAALRAELAWRSWSRVEPAVHYAFYQFTDVAAALAALHSEAMQGLIADYDAAWGGRVERSRDVVEVAQTIAGEVGGG